jgi:Ca2+-binding RTX toxin-like protein
LTAYSWSPGTDVINGPQSDREYLHDMFADMCLFDAFSFLEWMSDSEISNGKGLTIDNSTGVMTVATSYGVVTGYGMNTFLDSGLDDVFIGSDANEGFKTLYGGYDIVTAGRGYDRFEVEYLTSWQRDITGFEITDYEAGETISLQSLGFTQSNYLESISTRYDEQNDRTYLSIQNDSVDLSDLVILHGEFVLKDANATFLETSYLDPNNSVEIYLDAAQTIMTTTDLTGVTVGDLVEPSASEFDYLDLRSLTGEWWVDAATDGLDGDTVGAGTAISFNAGSYGDYYDFRGFEGYIVSGNTDGSEFTLETADGVDDIVVIDGGSGLRIVLDPAIASTGDVLSFRGTNDGVTIDLSAADQYGITSFNLASSVDPNGEVRGADYLFGSEAGDDFTGYTDESNILAGYGGGDDLTGGNLSDILIGGTGVDTLSGLAGNDVLIDLDDGTLTGGDGNDLFVVRGTNNTGTNTEVADFELGANGPGLGGGNKSYADRIAFNFSVTALASTSLSAAEGGLLSNIDYETLENLISIEITEGSDPSRDFTITATLSAANQTDTNAVDITLGTLDVTLDPSTTLDTSKERLEYRIEDQEDFLASIKSTVLDQMLYNQSALDVSGTQTDTSQMLDDTVNLFISLVREDKFAVPGGQGKPVLVALRDKDTGADLGTNFRPGKGNEVIAAGRADDKITIQQDPEMSVADTYGRDTVVERGGDNDQIIMPLSLQDLLDTDDLDLSRTQRGREGEGKTLRIEYSNEDPDSINDVDLMVYKQYNDYSTSFRVENLTLYNDDGAGSYTEVSYDLGTVTATGLETTSTDAILVGRSGIADEMVVKFNAGEAGIDKILDIVLADVTGEDTVSIEGYGDVTSVADGSETNATTDHQVVTTDTGYTINLYFTDYTTTNDEWLLNTITAP